MLPLIADEVLDNKNEMSATKENLSNLRAELRQAIYLVAFMQYFWIIVTVIAMMKFMR
jgi:hypothetical protein